jgi:hypothetical protein
MQTRNPKIVALAALILFGAALGWAANVYIGSLTADTSPSSTDLMETEKDPSGTPSSRKVTLGDAITKAHGLSSGVAKVASSALTTTTPYSYIMLGAAGFKKYGSSVTAPATTATAFNYGLPKFSNSADKANNYIEWVIQVPPDVDTAIDMTGTLKLYLGGADTGDHEYILSMVSVADSAAADATPGTAIALAYTADASGADGDAETAGPTTLTGWKAAVTAGQLWVIRLERDGDHANDTSTVDSYPLLVTIKYGYIP